jgi:hypothetical protein
LVGPGGGGGTTNALATLEPEDSGVGGAGPSEPLNQVSSFPKGALHTLIKPDSKARTATEILIQFVISFRKTGIALAASHGRISPQVRFGELKLHQKSRLKKPAVGIHLSKDCRALFLLQVSV